MRTMTPGTLDFSDYLKSGQFNNLVDDIIDTDWKAHPLAKEVKLTFQIEDGLSLILSASDVTLEGPERYSLGPSLQFESTEDDRQITLQVDSSVQWIPDDPSRPLESGKRVLGAGFQFQVK